MIAFRPAGKDAPVPGFPLESVQLRGDEKVPEGWEVLDDDAYAKHVDGLAQAVVEAEAVAEEAKVSAAAVEASEAARIEDAPIDSEDARIRRIVIIEVERALRAREKS